MTIRPSPSAASEVSGATGPDPTQWPRRPQVRAFDEAQREGWLGEVGGLEISLAAATHKLADMDRLAAHRRTVESLGPSHASRIVTDSEPSAGKKPS